MQRYKTRNGQWAILNPTAIKPRDYEKPTSYQPQTVREAELMIKVIQEVHYLKDKQDYDFRRGVH